MSTGILMQYLGFESANGGRAYAFQVRYSAEDVRDYTITITNETFASRRVSYQDGPNVCSSKLKRELTANPDLPTGTAFVVGEKELAEAKATR
jgi:hypothetical protein